MSDQVERFAEGVYLKYTYSTGLWFQYSNPRSVIERLEEERDEWEKRAHRANEVIHKAIEEFEKRAERALEYRDLCAPSDRPRRLRHEQVANANSSAASFLVLQQELDRGATLVVSR